MHPVSKELRYQREQGFLELKECYFSPNFYFSLRNELFGNKHRLKMNRKGVLYRNEKGPSMFCDGKGLLSLPSSAYEPFHKTMNHLVTLIGEGGAASASRFEKYDRDGDDSWRWVLREEGTLEEELEIYRYGKFRYNSPKGTTLEFLPDNNPSVNKGELMLDIRFRDLRELDLSVIDTSATYLESL